jgi:hypothetical protein
VVQIRICVDAARRESLVHYTQASLKELTVVHLENVFLLKKEFKQRLKRNVKINLT